MVNFNGDYRHDLLELAIVWDKFKEVHKGTKNVTIKTEYRQIQFKEGQLR